jgi:hypothetical protein
VLNCTGFFAKEYKNWIVHGDGSTKTNNFHSFKSFWENAVQLASCTSVPASHHGYSMAGNNNNASTQSLMDVDTNFWVAYATTQEQESL